MVQTSAVETVGMVTASVISSASASTFAAPGSSQAPPSQVTLEIDLSVGRPIARRRLGERGGSVAQWRRP